MTKVEKPEKVPDPAIRRCIDAFYAASVRRCNPPEMAEQWLAGHGTPEWRTTERPYPKEQMALPLISGGKDTALVKKMLAAWGEVTVLRLIATFFEASRTDPRVVRANWDVGGLWMNAQYLLTKPLRVTDRKTVENLDAASRAMQPTRKAG